MILVHLSIMVSDTDPLEVLQLSLVLLHARLRCSKREQSTGALHFAAAFVAAVARVSCWDRTCLCSKSLGITSFFCPCLGPYCTAGRRCTNGCALTLIGIEHCINFS